MDSPHSVDVEQVAQTLGKLMVIADRLDTRNAQTAQQVEAAAASLAQNARLIGGDAQQFAATALQLIATHTQQALSQGAEQAIGHFRRQLEQSAEGARAAAHAMDVQRRGLTATRRTLLWNAMAALLVGSLLATGGSAWVVHRSAQELRQAHFGQDILQATQFGTIARCGELLCAKVGKKPRHYGKDGEFVLLSH